MLTLREKINPDYIKNIPGKDQALDYLEDMYEMYKSSKTKDCQEFAFLSILNILFVCFSKKEYEYAQNLSVCDLEDFDSVIAMTLYRAMNNYKEKKGGVKFSYYLIKSVKRELYKEYKVSLPFHYPHTTDKNNIKLFQSVNANPKKFNIINLNSDDVVSGIIDEQITDSVLRKREGDFKTLTDEYFKKDIEFDELICKLKKITGFEMFAYKYGIFGTPHTFEETAEHFQISTKKARYTIEIFIQRAKGCKYMQDYRAA